MASDQPKTIPLELEAYRANTATLRTDIAPSAGTVKRPRFSVDFSILYEVRGNFEPSDKDNASLLVIRMNPFPKDHERQFLWFSVKLSVLETREKYKQRILSNDDAEEHTIPVFKSFEPASQGGQAFDVYTTNEARERMALASGQIPIAQTASLGGQFSATNKSEFKRTHLLSVTARGGNDDPSLTRNICNRVTWRISAANEDQGIGDSFTVALLVKRPPGSRFQLLAEVDGDVGSFVQKAKKFVPQGLGGKKEPTSLGTFPMDTSNQKLPHGVVAQDLHRASTENVMRKIQEVGLHLPEQARPTRSSPDVVSTTSLELNSMEPPGDNDDSLVEKEHQERGGGAHQAPEAPPPSALSRAPFDGQRRAATSQPCAQAIPPTLAPSAHVADSLATITRQLQVMMGALQREPHQAPAQGSMARVRRHREMASLYERLAELHRDEAKDSLPVFASGLEDQSQTDT